MALIVIADDGVVFDGETPSHSALGGAETAVIGVAEALARRGHRVEVFTRCTAPLTVRGVAWRPIAAGLPPRADLYVANRSNHLIGAVPAARQVFWTHNDCRYMLKARYLWPLWRHRPVVVFVSAFHASTLPAWVPAGGRAVIPLAVEEVFRGGARDAVPPPRAIFTSNPLRGLDGLLDLWRTDIAPQVAGAELVLRCNFSTAGLKNPRTAARLRDLRTMAEAAAACGVRVLPLASKADLAADLGGSRVLLYPATTEETFCLAVAEAQAMGVPAVVSALGALPERVEDGHTGYVAGDPAAFAARALEVLRDDGLWRRLSDRAVEHGRGWTWDSAAAAFEAVLTGANLTGKGEGHE